MAVTELNSSEFEAFVKNNKIVVVDCWAPWCGPCRRMGPEVDKVAEEMPTVAVAKLNTDENQEIAMRFGINAIPTLLFFVDGVQKESLVGLRPAADIMAYIAKLTE